MSHRADSGSHLHAMMDSIRGEVTARMSIFHSFTKYATPARIQFPSVQSRLMITPEKVLCSMLNHSTSAETSAQEMTNRKNKHFSKNVFEPATTNCSFSSQSNICIVLALSNLLRTMEIILIPASDIPVKNLRMTNIVYDVENTLSTANIRDVR